MPSAQGHRKVRKKKIKAVGRDKGEKKGTKKKIKGKGNGEVYKTASCEEGE